MSSYIRPTTADLDLLMIGFALTEAGVPEVDRLGRLLTIRERVRIAVDRLRAQRDRLPDWLTDLLRRVFEVAVVAWCMPEIAKEAWHLYIDGREQP